MRTMLAAALASFTVLTCPLAGADLAKIEWLLCLRNSLRSDRTI